MRSRLVTLFVGVLGLVAPIARAATITVDASCSLVEAIRAANQDFPEGACAAGDGADTIALTVDVTLLYRVDDVFGGNALPSIASEITIEGNGHRIARDTSAGTYRFRIFYVREVGRLTLESTRVTGGSANEGGSLTARGGAIFNKGFVRLEGVDLHDNEATIARAGATAVSAEGGAIYNEGELEVVDSSLYSNRASAENSTTVGFAPADARGGAIFGGPSSTIWIERSSLHDNLATSVGALARSHGGGVDSRSGVQLRQSSLLANTARAEGATEAHAFGGAFALAGNGLDSSALNTSYLEGNSALAVSLDGEAAGGAVYAAQDAQVRISTSTFASNSVKPPVNAVLPSGGAIEAQGASELSLMRATLVGNGILGHPGPFGGTTLNGASPSGILIDGSIFDRTAPGGSACAGFLDMGLLGGNFGCLPGDPAVSGLASLAGANGGPTPTFALDATSNAVDAVRNCSVSDQRGVSAIGTCDSGAYEYNPCTGDDDFEELPGDVNDDACPGGWIEVGTTQTHRHCDPDWVQFDIFAGSTYEIRTLNLINRSDTELELRQASCGEVLATDDDGGPDGASRIVLAAAATETLDLGITQALDSYDPGPSPPGTVEGYDVQVRCIESCSCTPPEGPDLLLADDTLDFAVTYEACSTIMASNWTVGTSGDVTLRAGEAVELGNGVSVAGTLAVEIDPGLAPP